MRNKGFFWSVTIVLILSCIYQLSFTWATYGVEEESKVYAQSSLDSLVDNKIPNIVVERETLQVGNPQHEENIKNYFAELYLKSQQNEETHFGYTYSECKEMEINLGLDLKGGMSVTLEIDVPALISELAGNTRNPDFRAAHAAAVIRMNAGEGDFVDLFGEEFKKISEDPLAKIFHMHNPEAVEPDASDREVLKFLSESSENSLDGVELIIEKRVNTFGVAQPTIQKQVATNRIFVELPGVKDRETVRRRLVSIANLEFFEVYDNIGNGSDGIGPKLFDEKLEKALSQALYGGESLIGTDTIPDSSLIGSPDTASTTPSLLSGNADGGNSLLNAGDTAAGNAANAASNDSLANLAEEMKKVPIRSVLTPSLVNVQDGQGSYAEGPIVGVAKVTDTSTVNLRLSHPVITAALPLDLEFMWDAKEVLDENRIETGYIRLYAIKVPPTGPKVGGKDIKRASRTSKEVGSFEVNMLFTNLGAKKWEEMTEANLLKPVAITMDKMVFSAPTVQEKMSSTSDITGNFTMSEADELAGLLNAGALPAPVKIVDEAVVGPSIGVGNFEMGMISFALAMVVVLFYMWFYYNKAGLVADISLIANIFLLIGALASLKAILTLPGIAGIVLTIGMAVDANVLIYERVREELRGGKGVKASVKEGFSMAMSSILDANITTLLTGVVLAVFGTGPIKGFATTLIIGIFTSVFAAVIITRLILTWFLDRDKKMTFSTRFTEKFMQNTKIQFVKRRKLFYLLSGGFLALGVVSLFARGLDWGVDFEGGRQYKVQFIDKPADHEAIVASLTTQFDGIAPQSKMVNDSYTALITTKYEINNPDTAMNNLVEAKLRDGLSGFGAFDIQESKMIAPTISKDLAKNALYAVGFSLLIIFLYIVFRFRSWQFGLGAVTALGHDVFMIVAVYSMCWGWIGFSMEIDQAFIAAILTVVGYSINDTVIVFDRIREYVAFYNRGVGREVIDEALNSTLTRTLNTSFTTFLVLLVIFIFGGDAIKGFVFAIMVGVVVGTYSSICIATPMVIDLSKKSQKKEKDEPALAKAV